MEDEDVETVPIEAAAPQYVEGPKEDNLKQIWQDFLQKCCEVGQLDKHIHDAENAVTDLQKKLEITKRQRNQLANKYNDVMKANAAKEKVNVEKESSQNQNN